MNFENFLEGSTSALNAYNATRDVEKKALLECLFSMSSASVTGSSAEIPREVVILGYSNLLTNNGPTRITLEAIPLSASGQITRLRMISGLTFDQIAQLLDVERRTLHFWASGRKISQQNFENLNRLLSVLENVDTGDITENVKQILTVRDGIMPFDLLVKKEYDVFLRLFSVKQRVQRPKPGNISSKEFTLRSGPRPADLVVPPPSSKESYKKVGKSRTVKVPRKVKRG